ncbi:hypothetical protein FB567DRAFT_601241 [Paraphoma chrysanthemicola]|uniref:Uncharacterized protein n=1 Tax=Paraphoma chrysanthemicola TaxID=798071 RepID=A0A8K0RHC4_9PLEO|nr:hypothetical protein FB567DRAFT_601241 [Paraphoma chrysanthemicola]
MADRMITRSEQGESLGAISVDWQDDHSEQTQQYDLIAIGGSSRLLTAQASGWWADPYQIDRVNHGVSSYYAYEQPTDTDPYPYSCWGHREPFANDFRADQTYDASNGVVMPGGYSNVTGPASTGWIQRGRHGGTEHDWTQAGQGNTNDIDLRVNPKDQTDCHRYAGRQELSTLATQTLDYSQSHGRSRQMKSRGGALNHASTLLSSSYDNLGARNGRSCDKSYIRTKVDPEDICNPGSANSSVLPLISFDGTTSPASSLSYGAKQTWGSDYACRRNLPVYSDQALSSQMTLDLSNVTVDAGRGDHEQPHGVAVVVHQSSPEIEATLSHTFGDYEEQRQ